MFVGIAWGAIAIVTLSFPAHGNSDLSSLKRELEDSYIQYQQFSDQGDFPNAERLGTLALELGEQIYGMDHPNTAVLSFNLAKTLNASTRFRWRGLRVAERGLHGAPKVRRGEAACWSTSLCHMAPDGGTSLRHIA